MPMGQKIDEAAELAAVQAGMLEVARELERQRRKLLKLAERGKMLPGYIEVAGRLHAGDDYAEGYVCDVVATGEIEAKDGDLPEMIKRLRRYGRLTAEQWQRDRDKRLLERQGYRSSSAGQRPEAHA